jgi:hypothetical protein
MNSHGSTGFRRRPRAYWDTLDPMFEWTAREKSERSWVFLAQKVLPHRDAVVSLARELATSTSRSMMTAPALTPPTPVVDWDSLA